MPLPYSGTRLRLQPIETTFGAGIEDVSAANAYADMVFEDNDVIFTRGYDSILAPLAKGLDIRLNTPVNRIACKDEGVEVNELAADYAAQRKQFNQTRL